MATSSSQSDSSESVATLRPLQDQPKPPAETDDLTPTLGHNHDGGHVGFFQTLRRLRRETTWFLGFALLAANLGPFQYGYHMAELNTPALIMDCSKSAKHGHGNLPSCFEMNKIQASAVSSIFIVGGFCGALWAAWSCSRNGRRWTMVQNGVLFIFASLIEGVAPHWGVLLVGRVVGGFAAGMATVVSPLYLSEVAPPRHRGLFGFLTQISINVGILVTQSTGYGFSFRREWRPVFYIGTGIACVYLALVLATDESPVWLFNRGSPNKAKKLLQRLRGNNIDVGREVDVWRKQNEVREASEQELLIGGPLDVSRQVNMLGAVIDPTIRRAVIAMVGCMFAQQFCGINVIIFYSVTMLDNLVPFSVGLLTIIVSIVNLLITIACAPLPDAIGRKTCLLTSIIGQGCSSLALCLSMYYHAQVITAIALVFFVGFFAVGLGPVCYILGSELVPQRAVEATQGWALCANYLATFIVVLCFPTLSDYIDKTTHSTGLVFAIPAGCSVFFALYVFFLVPETKGTRNSVEAWERHSASLRRWRHAEVR